MKSNVSDSSIILYQTEDGRTRIQCRFEDDTVWLTQALIAELFQVTVPTINEHIKGIFSDGELESLATIRKFRIVRTEGKRQVQREVEHYNLSVILSIGYRVRSHRGAQFRYSPDTEISQDFFATVQNKMHWAAHGHTAAELIHKRANANDKTGLGS